MPPVGWQSTVEQPLQITTVCAWLNTVVLREARESTGWGQDGVSECSDAIGLCATASQKIYCSTPVSEADPDHAASGSYGSDCGYGGRQRVLQKACMPAAAVFGVLSAAKGCVASASLHRACGTGHMRTC